METRLKCGEYRCTNRNPPVEQARDKRSNREREDGKPNKPELSDLRCRVHAGGIKRSYWQADPVPLTLTDTSRLLKEQRVLDEEAAEKAKKDRIEAEKRDAENFAEEWAYTDVKAEFAIAPDRDRESFNDEPAFEGLIWTGERPQRGWESRWFDLKPSHRYYRELREGERAYPYIIRMSRGGDMTSNEARALAAALNAGADRADEMNARRRP